jgi:hypothetical protein
MATRDTLIFLKGRRWPGVRPTDGVGYVNLQELWQFAFAAGGDGQSWHTYQPLAFWRSFAEIEFDYTAEAKERARRFIARHGDPLGDLDSRRVGTNANWPALTDALYSIAQAWDPPDPSKTSFMSNDPERIAAAQAALYELARPDQQGLLDIEWIAQESALVPRAKTLRAFMIASAASALRRGIAMRICALCGDWFELRRADAVYCSGSCQAADYKKQKAMAPEATDLETASHKLKGHLYGKRTQTAPSRSGHVPRHLARKRSRRKGAAAK